MLQRLLSSMAKRKIDFSSADLVAMKGKWKTLQYILVLVIFTCLGINLLKNWNDVRGYKWHFHYSFLAFSFLLLVGISFFLAFNWGLILRLFSQNLGWRQSTKIWLLSQIAKYLPGGIWNWVGRVYWCEREGVPKAETVGSIVLETVLMLLSGMIVIFSVSVLGVDITLKGSRVLYLIAILGGLFVFLLALSTWTRGLNFALRLLGKGEMRFDFDNSRRGDILVLLVLYILVAIISGISFYLFTLSIYPLPFAALLPIMGIHWISFILGFLSPFVPSGLGIRESTLALLLSYYLPTSAAIVISLLARIWLIIGELIGAAIALRL